MLEKEAVQNIINEIGDSIARWGLPKHVGLIYGTLYVKGDMTQDQLKEEIGCSNSRISESLTVFEKFGIVKISGKDGRKNVYSAVTSTKEILKKAMRNKMEYEFNPFLEVVKDNYDSIENKERKERVSKLKKQMEFGIKMSSFIMKFPGLK